MPTSPRPIEPPSPSTIPSSGLPPDTSTWWDRNKWYAIGGFGLLLVAVFFYARSKSQKTATSTTQPTPPVALQLAPGTVLTGPGGEGTGGNLAAAFTKALESIDYRINALQQQITTQPSSSNTTNNSSSSITSTAGGSGNGQQTTTSFPPPAPPEAGVGYFGSQQLQYLQTHMNQPGGVSPQAYQDVATAYEQILQTQGPQAAQSYHYVWSGPGQVSEIPAIPPVYSLT